jgi:hypothetical protein
MPSTSNYGFEYESPTSLPGASLTGGPGGSSPILAIQVDTALAALASTVTNNIAAIATNTTGLSTANTNITNLQNWMRRGAVTMTFASSVSATTAVNFGFTFPGVPTVMTNIDSGSGSTSRWESRAITVTTTGFTMFVYQSQAIASAWTDIPVNYVAHYD